MSLRYNKKWAIETVRSEPRSKFVFFWSSKLRPDGVLTDAVFSQWASTPFQDDTGQIFPTAEHFMMVAKARLFGANHTATDILSSESPGRAKALGRQIISFDQTIWEKKREQIVLQGNMFKFTRNTHLADYILRTGNKILVEASPIDPIWGIGLSSDDPAVRRPWDWKGENLLGFALMEIRDTLRTSS